jgi:hypothetical protein
MKATLKHEAWDNGILFDHEDDAYAALLQLTAEYREGYGEPTTDDEWLEVCLREAWNVETVVTWYEFQAQGGVA